MDYATTTLRVCVYVCLSRDFIISVQNIHIINLLPIYGTSTQINIMEGVSYSAKVSELVHTTES